jgi:hypothetical protein
MREKHYGILDEKGFQCGSVWATSVQPRNPDGWFFLHGATVVASAWDGYKDIETKEIFLRNRSTQPDAQEVR